MMNARQRREAGIGGKGTSGRYKYTGKATVMAMLERGGKVVAKVVGDRRQTSLLPPIMAHVARGTTVHEYRAYETLGTPFTGMDYEHQVIDHSAAYVPENVHTNNVENFWSLLKRRLRGTYISVEPFHLARYLDEQIYRFNERKHPTVAGSSRRFRSIVGETHHLQGIDRPGRVGSCGLRPNGRVVESEETHAQSPRAYARST